MLARATSDPGWSNPPPAEAQPIPSFDQLYREHFSFVWHCLRRLGVEEAALRDAAQDTFLVVHRRLLEFEGRSPLRSWLYGIAVRVASNYRRTKHRRDGRLHEADLDSLADANESTQQDSVEQRQSLVLVHQLIQQLDEDKRQAFVLAEIQELSVAEIAAILDVNPGTIYARLRAARIQFDRIVVRHLAKNKRSP